MVKSAIPAAPRVRIVQVCSPRIVHADLKSFRTTVQKLTGFRPQASGEKAKDIIQALHQRGEAFHRPIIQSKEAMNVKEEPYLAGFDSKEEKKWRTDARFHAVPDYYSHESDLKMDLQRFFRAYENQCTLSLEQQIVDGDLDVEDRSLESKATPGIAEGKLKAMHPRAHFPACMSTLEFEDDWLSLSHFFTEESSAIS